MKNDNKALKYLNELDKPVIHYDLKPGEFIASTDSLLNEYK